MEIGSVLELDSFTKYQIAEIKKTFRLPFMKSDKEYGSAFYQSARNAIEALLAYLKDNRGIESVLLPDYMCETVIGAAKRANVDVKTYRVNRKYEYSFEEIESLLDEKTSLFVAQFFGKKIESKTLERIKALKDSGTIVIEDLTLSIFSKDGDNVGFGNYIVGSIRKWLPIPDGGFILSESESLPDVSSVTVVSKYTDYYYAVQAMKKIYIDGGCADKELKKTYLGYYNLSIKELFSDYTVYPMSEWSFNYINNCDLEKIIKIRRDNYDYLYNKLNEIDGIELQVKREGDYLPFGMLIFTKWRDELLQYLISKDIYCNVHWRLEAINNNPEIEYLSKHTMTIPCDQRYTYEDMDRIADALKDWVETKNDCISS